MSEKEVFEAGWMTRSLGITPGKGRAISAPCRWRLLTPLFLSPCAAPRVVTAPENTRNRTGGRAAMTCEVTGFPVPTVEWRVDRGDGPLKALPSEYMYHSSLPWTTASFH